MFNQAAETFYKKPLRFCFGFVKRSGIHPFYFKAGGAVGAFCRILKKAGEGGASVAALPKALIVFVRFYERKGAELKDVPVFFVKGDLLFYFFFFDAG